MPERRRSQLRTAMAMAALCWARFLVAAVPFGWWRSSLGGTVKQGASEYQANNARRLAANVEWAARRLPLSTDCLPRAMALSWMLRSRRIGHSVVIAVRPSQLRQLPDALHAWVEVDGELVLGELPGPWAEILRLGV